MLSNRIAQLKVFCLSFHAIGKEAKGGGGGVLFPHIVNLVVGSGGFSEPWEWSGIGIYTGAIGLLAGAIVGGLFGIDKKIQIEGMTDSEIQKTMDKLRKKARIRDYR